MGEKVAKGERADEKRGREKGEGERHPLYSPEISNGPPTGTFWMNMTVWMEGGGVWNSLISKNSFFKTFAYSLKIIHYSLKC